MHILGLLVLSSQCLKNPQRPLKIYIFSKKIYVHSVFLYMYMCLYVYMHMYICVYMFIFPTYVGIYAHKHIHCGCFKSYEA